MLRWCQGQWGSSLSIHQQNIFIFISLCSTAIVLPLNSSIQKTLYIYIYLIYERCHDDCKSPSNLKNDHVRIIVDLAIYSFVFSMSGDCCSSIDLDVVVRLHWTCGYTRAKHVKCKVMLLAGTVFTIKPLILGAPNPKTWMSFVSSCRCLCLNHWSRKWKCCRRCSNHIWVINNDMAY